MEGVKDGVVPACCIVVFLAQASYRSVAHRQHVEARMMGLLSRVNGSLRGLAGTHAHARQHLLLYRSCRRRRWPWSLRRPACFDGQGPCQPGP
jgi:hypothetical protein